MSSGMTRGRRQKRQRKNQFPHHETKEHDELPTRIKRPKASCKDLFDSYMTDDTFLMVLRFFVSDSSGLVDGDSIRSIMLVSKRWYTAANSRSLWTLPEAQHTKKEHLVHRIPKRPSPLIREICQRPRAGSFATALVGFVNLGRRSTVDGRPLYSARERATGNLFLVDILDLDDNRAIRSAMSAHHLLGDDFLNSLGDESSLLLPVGMEGSNGKVIGWFKHANSLSNWVRNPEVASLEIFKDWLRQMLEAAQKIHCTDAVHSCIEPSNVYLTSSMESQTTSFKLACPSLFPVVPSFDPSTKCLKYTSPELLIPLSKGLRVEPTSAADIFSIGCVMAEVFRNGVSLFGSGPREMNSLSTYARAVCRLVGRPPSCSSALRSLQHHEFPLDSTKNLKRELSELDEDGLDLMKRLLSPDPSKRPTAEAALAHPFLVEAHHNYPVTSSVGEPLRKELKRISLHLTRESQCQQLTSSRKHVRLDAWATLVDYVVEIVEVFDLEISAAFRAMGYFDRFFSSYQGSGSFTSRRCQLVAGTCLYIASKCDQTELSKNDLTFCADNTFDHNDVSIAEEVILHQLDWNLSYPTILDFVKLMCNALDLEKKAKPRLMAHYIAELALQCQVYLTHRPSLVASCVVALALFCVGTRDPWPDALAEATGYSWNDLEQCILALSSDIHHVRATMPTLKIITRRYRKAQNGRVALIHIPRITTFSALTNPARAQS